MKYFFSVFTLIISFISVSGQSLDHQWSFPIDANIEAEVKGLAVNENGDIHVTGFYRKTADFDPGPGTFILTTPTFERWSFVAKYTHDGNLLWAFLLEGDDSNNRSQTITVDNLDNVYVGGYFEDTVDFNPGTASAKLIATYGYQSGFMAKYDPNGNFLWAGKIGGIGSSRVLTIDTDNNRNLFIGGHFYKTADFGGVSHSPPSSNYSIQGFIASYDENSNFRWANHLETLGTINVQDLKIGNNGVVNAAGDYRGMNDFEPGVNVTSLPNYGYEDIFFTQYDNNGNYISAQGFGSSGNDFVHTINLDPFDNVYIGGEFDGSIDFDPGSGQDLQNTNGSSGNGFVAKYNSTGNYTSHIHIEGLSWNKVKGVHVNKNNEMTIAGDFRGNVDLDNDGVYTLQHASAGIDDLFIAKYDSNSVLQSSISIGGTTKEFITAFGVIPGGDVVLGGNFEGVIDFDPDTGLSEFTSESIYGNGFFARYGSGCLTSITQESTGVCNGDSLFLEGNWQMQAGTYYDEFTSISGCDSIIETVLSVYSIPDTVVYFESICSNDSLYVGGSWQKNAGIYFDHQLSINGCDSIEKTVLSLDLLLQLQLTQ